MPTTNNNNNDDYIFHTSGGTIMSGGFVIDLKHGGGDDIQSGGNHIYDNYGMPAVLSVFRGGRHKRSTTNVVIHDEDISSDLYDKLLKNAQWTPSSKQKQSKKQVIKPDKVGEHKTRKHRANKS